MSAAMASEAASLVRRSRAGDQNAQALIAMVGREARKGVPRARTAFELLRQYIDANPPQEFALGTEPALVMDPPKVSLVKTKPAKKMDPELRKPPLPRGSLEGLFYPDQMAICILRACAYRHGLQGAAVVLAGGPPLTNDRVEEIGSSNFGKDTDEFFYGVRFCGEGAWKEVAPSLDLMGQQCLAVGQCIGRARKIQALRRGGRISSVSPTVGWELGE